MNWIMVAVNSLIGVSVFCAFYFSWLRYVNKPIREAKRHLSVLRKTINIYTKSVLKSEFSIATFEAVLKKLKEYQKEFEFERDYFLEKWAEAYNEYVKSNSGTPIVGERCDVCGGELRVDEHGELRCFECNPPQDAPQFAVGDAVRFKCDGKRATITDVKDDHIEVQDDDGNISACHVEDIERG